MIHIRSEIIGHGHYVPSKVLTNDDLSKMVDTNDEDYPLYQYLASTDAKLDKLYEVPYLIKTPIVRNGKQATVGYCPEVWKDWK